MSISYSTNWMGPLNLSWVKENGDCWAMGRIDIRGVKDEPFGLEYGLGPMHVEDWNTFSDYLDTKLTRRLYSFEELIADYEKKNPPIRWCSE